MTKPVDPIARIIGHVRSARYEDLPERVVAVAKKAIVDTVGAGIAGSSAPMGKLVAELAREHGGRPDSTLWVYGDKVPAPEAAFANAIMARCCELDDVHEGTPRLGDGHGGHVNVMIVPAALATVEALGRRVTGKELITAIAVGGDLIPRIRVAAGGPGASAGRAPPWRRSVSPRPSASCWGSLTT